MKPLAPLSFELAGTFAVKNPQASQLTLSVREFALQTGQAEFRGIEIDASFDQQLLTMDKARASAFGGEVTLSGSAQPFAEVPSWRAEVQGKDFALANLLESHGQNPQPGRLTANVSVSGGATLPSIKGGGDLFLENARFDSTPILGPLRKLLTQTVPIRSSTEGATDSVSSTFAMADGKVTTQDLKISVPAFQATIKGEIDWLAQSGNFTALATPRGPIIDLAAKLPGKALEIEGSGSIDGFSWRFKNLETVKKIFDVLGPVDPIKLIPKVLPKFGKKKGKVDPDEASESEPVR
jgi:hypothetical protein